ncbi:MAG: hypothetical protein A2Y82_05490 [Candidatus Buchananbacteria bacterium RBG_13_36_9]|uniref:Uncharacterized protein n=1 Tax=Candidatus Buchananbacteria bacterium RBG_13_36_9 TaxID=1797530 RepID=A0A1G1XP79_9BACT|nr:MAG: hypothetical protein A2Y82_05490 [Candidatus Buchananbacteria bacterium RBG_13_36_9]
MPEKISVPESDDPEFWSDPDKYIKEHQASERKNKTNETEKKLETIEQKMQGIIDAYFEGDWEKFRQASKAIKVLNELGIRKHRLERELGSLKKRK